MNQFLWFFFAFSLAVIFDLYFIGAWRRYRQLKQDYVESGEGISRWDLWKQAILSKKTKSVIASMRKRALGSEFFRESVGIAIELILLTLWVVYVGKDYLNFDQLVIPAGREFGSSIQAHHLWTRFQTCGGCALWDGSERGGFPAFVDPLASTLHPAVIITTLLFGVVNGAKVMVVVSLWIAGFAQWWLGRVLRLGRVSRLIGALMVVVGGHLAGRMELGIVSLILSMAMVSMTFAPVIALSKTGSKRSMVLLAVVYSLVAVSGQGYMQVGFLMMLPAYLILIINARVGAWFLVKRYLTATVLGLFLAAPFLIPFIHFLPNFTKGSDPYLSAGQPLSYYILNLFIDNRDFYYDTSLGKLPFPNMYVMFVGWIPAAFALICVWVAKKEDRRPLIFLTVSAALVLFVGSMLPLQWLRPVFPVVTYLRYITMIGGLAVPAIIGLATYSLDKLIQRNWPHFTMIFPGELTPRYKGVSLGLILVIPMVFAIRRSYVFSQIWLYTVKLDDGVIQLLEALETPDVQWVQAPYGEHIYIEPAVRMGMKLSPGIMTWRWEGRKSPVPFLEANRSLPAEGNVRQVNKIDGIPIYERADQYYAAVYSDGSPQTCQAYGNGGYIDVYCNTSTPGKLIVKENTFLGWKVWLDGGNARLTGTQWLEVSAPTGNHIYQFRYWPWDVPLGIAVFLVGVILCVYLWRADVEKGICNNEFAPNDDVRTICNG
jgi:hypothetical protein